MQINYHSVLKKNSKITKLKKKKDFFLTRSVHLVLPKIGWYAWYLNQYETLAFRYQYMYQYGTYWLIRPVLVQYRPPCSHDNLVILSQHKFKLVSMCPSRSSKMQLHLSKADFTTILLLALKLLPNYKQSTKIQL